ncbi:MAG: hypothetical protein AAB941_00335 [Patescibacteria group bacterium]
MPEGHNFEKHETSPQAKVDFESILEKGEIKSARTLEGYWGMQLVEIKDDGDALFRPDMYSDFIFEAKEMEIRRSDLELMSYKIDQILEFNLVPTVTDRTIGELKGTLQRRIQNFHDGYGTEWEMEVRPEEITRAAIFDYLLDVKDRHHGNFIIDSDTGKLWLIDHDFYMFFWEQARTLLVEKALEKGLATLGGFEMTSLERFLAHADSLTIGAKPEIIEIIKKAQDRAEILLEEGQIPVDNA